MRPGAPPKSCGYVFTGPGEVSSLVTDPQGPRWPPAIYIKKKKYDRSFSPIQMLHTHTFFLELTLMVGSAGLFELRFHRRVGLKAIASFWGPASGIYSLFMFFWTYSWNFCWKSAVFSWSKRGMFVPGSSCEGFFLKNCCKWGIPPR